MAKKRKQVDVFAVHGVDELFQISPSDFTKRRNDLAKQLRKEGRRAEADAVGALRRPTQVAWALNQTARATPERIGELATAGEAVRVSQQQLLDEGEPEDLRAADRQRRNIIIGLADDAARLLGGKKRDAIIAALEAASVQPDVARALKDGRLVKEPEQLSGFGLGTLLTEPGRSRRRRRRPDRREIRRRERDLERADRDLQGALEHAARAEMRAAETAAAAATARRAADEAEKTRQQAADAVAAARRTE